MVSEWREISLGEFVRLQRGHDLTASEQKPGKVPVMGSAGPNGSHDKATTFGPGVVIGRSGASAGRVHYCSTDFWAHNTSLYVTDFIGNNPRFAYYLLQTIDLASFNSGSAQPSLNRNYIYSIKLQVPPREQQDWIASTLSALDDKIALLRETNTTLEAIAQALFKSWFVDFDPVRAKAEGRDPEGVPPEVADLFPSEFEDSALGAIPKGWRVRKWGDLVSLEYGKALRGYRESMGQIPVYGTNGPIGFHDEPHCNHPGIVVGRKGAYRGIHFSPEPFCVIDTAFFMEGREDLSWRWAFYEALRFDLNSMDSGSAIPSTDRNLFYRITICTPAISLQKAFEDLLASTWEKQNANNREVMLLSDLRDTLLPRLMSGKMRISDSSAESE